LVLDPISLLYERFVRYKLWLVRRSDLRLSQCGPADVRHVSRLTLRIFPYHGLLRLLAPWKLGRVTYIDISIRKDPGINFKLLRPALVDLAHSNLWKWIPFGGSTSQSVTVESACGSYFLSLASLAAVPPATCGPAIRCDNYSYILSRFTIPGYFLCTAGSSTCWTAPPPLIHRQNNQKYAGNPFLVRSTSVWPGISRNRLGFPTFLFLVPRSYLFFFPFVKSYFLADRNV